MILKNQPGLIAAFRFVIFFGVIELTGWISARKSRHAKSALSLLPDGKDSDFAVCRVLFASGIIVLSGWILNP
ncbi:MAG: hypothetical protein C6P37_16745 [Caldibacillus debilis]|uniref:Uncharacterized protein n=1 Tax=Caldibacillus debilis TaxID=301148 RepID=A0A3E0JVF9_9BACI|nr:MAG: hypothetical protein C6W57_00265 [Caldibacillus debilis]REJ23745.1 MAG: hypothetical protein C6P37_16745 [Caldibacillus debilis]